MGYAFPNTPTIGQVANGYTWDGEKWTKSTAAAGAGPSTSLPLALGTASAGSVAEYSRGDHVHPAVASDATKLNVAGNQTTTGGFRFTPYNAGTLTGGQTFTPNAYNGQYQFYINGGAHTINAPANDCAVDVLVSNSGSAGAITFFGFTIGSGTTAPGDALTTTNTHQFVISIRRINGVSTYVVKALQ